MNAFKKARVFIKGGIACMLLASILLVTGTIFADDSTMPSESAPVEADAVPVEDNNAPASTQDQAPDPAETELPPDLLPEESAEEQESAETAHPEATAAETAVAELHEEPPPGEEADLLPEALDNLAQNELTLMVEGGAPLDLASQDSLEIVSSADPWWMVGAVKYAYIKTGGTCPDGTSIAGGNCFESDTPISTALTYMDQNNLIPTDGILHVEPDTYNESNISVDGSIVAGVSWGNLSRLKGIISEGTSNDTLINGNVTISHTTLGFTLQGFSITGAVGVFDNVGILNLTDLEVTNASGRGIDVYNHNGAVNVNGVISSRNKTDGMRLSNKSGTANVTVSNSEFSHNDDGNASQHYYGLDIDTFGTITLNGVAACNNDGTGARLSAAKGTTIKNSIFSANLASSGYGNFGYGVNINLGSTTNNVILENVKADDNTNFGLSINTGGSVTLKNVSVYNNGAGTNFYSGVDINNKWGSGAVTVTNSVFNKNGSYGLRILSHKNVTLNGITALDNTKSGVWIDNCDWNGTACLGRGTVAVTGKLPNYFNNNNGHGLEVQSSGNVTLSNFQADGNIYSGVLIRNDFAGCSGNVTLNVTYVPTVGTWTNSASDNNQSGLRVYSFGNISLDRCLSSGNNDYGAYIENDSASAARTVTVRNSSFTGNGTNGLAINSKGNVTINNSNAYDHAGGSGLYIDNSYGPGSVTISSIGAVKNDYSDNYYYGLDITSAGIVTISNIDATGSGYGIRVDNTYGIGKGVTVSNADCSGSTIGEGLLIYSKGAITITDIVSNDNALNQGANLSNSNASTPQTIKVTRGQFNGNISSYGLVITSRGAVTLNSVQANENGGDGAWINTCIYNGGMDQCDGTGGLTVSGSGNSFSRNGAYGLYVYSRGGVSLSNVAIDENGSTGLHLLHYHSNCSGTVTLTSTGGGMNSISNNGYYGAEIKTVGIVTLSNLNANTNFNDSGYTYTNIFGTFYIDNTYGSVGRNVTITNAHFNSNQEDGLYIASKGLVTLNGVETSDNSKHFWEIDDDSGAIVNDRLPREQEYGEVWWFEGSASQGVTIDLKSSAFDAYLELYDQDWHLLAADNDSGASGEDAQITYTLPSAQIYYLMVKSNVEGEYGKYQLSMGSGSAFDFAYIGINVNNGSGSADVLIKKNSASGYGALAQDNNSMGLNVYSRGNITFSNVETRYNGGYYGANLDNGSVENKNVTLTSCIFDENDGEGLYLQSHGTVTWSNGSADGNRGGDGAYLYNDGSALPRNISISNVTCDENAVNGLGVYTLGRISLNNVSASSNAGGYGAFLDNCRWNAGISGCQGSGDVQITGTYGKLEFNNNSGTGLEVRSRNNISVTNINACGSLTSVGSFLRNDYENASGGVTVKTTSAALYSLLSDNVNTGLIIYSKGAVSVANLTASNIDSGTGVYIENNGAAMAQPVNLTRVNTSSNDQYGISVLSVGAITLNSVESNENNNYSIYLRNSSSPTGQGVTVNSVVANDNAGTSGLVITSAGVVTLNNIVAKNNIYGAVIDNTASSVNAKVNLLSSLGENVFSGNVNHGLEIDSDGDVSLSKVIAEWNNWNGIDVDTLGKLTATSVITYHNAMHGMNIDADSGVIINGLQSCGNGSASNYDGLQILVNPGSMVSILNSMISGNYGNGIDISNCAAPVLTGTFYFGNDINDTGDSNIYLH